MKVASDVTIIYDITNYSANGFVQRESFLGNLWRNSLYRKRYKITTGTGIAK